MTTATIIQYATSISSTVTSSREMADAIANEFGLTYDKSWHAEGNGGSFYFKINGSKIRISDHRNLYPSSCAYWDVQVRPVNAGYFEDRGLPVPSCNFSAELVKGSIKTPAYRPMMDKAEYARKRQERVSL